MVVATFLRWRADVRGVRAPAAAVNPDRATKLKVAVGLFTCMGQRPRALHVLIASSGFNA
jgi:hypothetical protein